MVSRHVILVPLVLCCLFLTSCGAISRSGNSPVDAGNGFAFSIVEKYSLDSVRSIETTFVHAGQTPVSRTIGFGTTPSRHKSGLVIQTERCSDPEAQFSFDLYSHIAIVDQLGNSTPVTPCSHQLSIDDDYASRLDFGQLSPDGNRVLAHLFTLGKPAGVAVFEGGQLIERFEGFHASAWIDDDTIALVGSGLATLRLGDRPELLTDALTGTLDSPAVSANGEKIAVVQDGAIWVIGVDGADLHEALPSEGYTFPTWSPDGEFVAALQREPISAFDGQLLGSPDLVGPLFWEYTHLQTMSIVNVGTGERFYADVSMLMTDSEMPHGRLTWF